MLQQIFSLLALFVAAFGDPRKSIEDYYDILLINEPFNHDYFFIHQDKRIETKEAISNEVLLSLRSRGGWASDLDIKLYLYDVLDEAGSVEGKLLLFCLESMSDIDDCLAQLFPQVLKRFQSAIHNHTLIQAKIRSYSLNFTSAMEAYHFMLDYGASVPHGPQNMMLTEECFSSWNVLDRMNFQMLAIHHEGLGAEVYDFLPKHSSIIPVEIVSSVLFEYIVYQSFFPFQLAKRRFADQVYVGLTTYRTISSAPLCGDEIKRLYDSGVRGDYDVIPLLFFPQRMLMIESIVAHTRNFKKAWDLLLQSMGYQLATIRKFDMIRPFYRNSMLIKPAWLRRLSRLMSRAVEHALFNDTVNAALSLPANYVGKGGDAEVARKIFGSDEYQLFPFVFERLVSFFLHAEGAVVHYDDAINGFF